MTINDLVHRACNRWKKLRLQPIRVYCLHHVCEHFDPELMNECDWMPIVEFKSKVLALQQSGVRFISLTEAHHRLRIALSPFAFRLKHYAVITFDDGYASLKEILPWLKEQKIPVTLFINGKYLDGQSYRKRPTEKYLTMDELQSLGETNGRGLIEIGSHGLEHTNAVEMDNEDFESSLVKNIALLSKHPNWIPFHAYTWGRHNYDTDSIIKKLNVIPVLIDGMKNYTDIFNIHRELLN